MRKLVIPENVKATGPDGEPFNGPSGKQLEVEAVPYYIGLTRDPGAFGSDGIDGVVAAIKVREALEKKKPRQTVYLDDDHWERGCRAIRKPSTNDPRIPGTLDMTIAHNALMFMNAWLEAPKVEPDELNKAGAAAVPLPARLRKKRRA